LGPEAAAAASKRMKSKQDFNDFPSPPSLSNIFAAFQPFNVSIGKLLEG